VPQGGAEVVTKPAIQIVDIIDHRSKYSTQVELVLNRMPEPLFERRGRWLVGNDDCVFQFYALERVEGPSHWKAFGGREFDIPMVDGSVERAKGQWWNSFPSDFRGLTYSHGVSTIDKLAECYVFYFGFHIDREIVDAWRASSEPSNNYRKYDPEHADFGKHRIVSPWEDSPCN
jgi:hypothetical protein